jgi:hypothetical protein
MFTDPVVLIDQTIDNLESLDALFIDEVDERIRGPERLSPEAKLCLDAHVAISALLPRLRAARIAQGGQQSSWHGAVCINCD